MYYMQYTRALLNDYSNTCIFQLTLNVFFYWTIIACIAGEELKVVDLNGMAMVFPKAFRIMKWMGERVSKMIMMRTLLPSGKRG